MLLDTVSDRLLPRIVSDYLKEARRYTQRENLVRLKLITDCYGADNVHAEIDKQKGVS